MTSPDSIPELAAGLTKLERELLLGIASGWGSWMSGVGLDLVAKGVGRRTGGSIVFDTPLGLAVRNHLIESNRHGE